MCNTWGGSLCRNGSKVLNQNNDFLQKSGLKTLILAVMVLDHLTSELAGTHNFKDIPNFHRCFKKSGTSVSKWAMGKSSNFNIVRIKIVWIFFRCGHEKKLKTAFFHKTLIPRNLLKEKNIRARSMWNLTSWRFRKCGTYWACEVLNGSYRPSKMDESEKTGPSSKIRGVKKNTAKPYGDALVWSAVFIVWLDWFELVS